jgi:hypothetical protein
MTPSSLCLTGTVRHSDTDTLRNQSLACLEQGGLCLLDDGLTEIESGPLQVLLCAAAEARNRALPCELDASATQVFNSALGKLHLADAQNFFTIISDRQAPVSQ